MADQAVGRLPSPLQFPSRFAVLRCSSMATIPRYKSHLRFPETDPFPEYGGVEPENEEGGVDPYSVRVRQALLHMRSPAQVRKVEWMVRLLYSRGTGGAAITGAQGQACMWLPGNVRQQVQTALNDAVSAGFVTVSGGKYQLTEEGRQHAW